MANAFTAVGDMSSLQASDLIFVYPIIFDAKLEKKYRNLIRDFQTLQFISQIKVANILNLTKSAVRDDEFNDDYISPAETLSNILNTGDNDALSRYQLSRQQPPQRRDRPHPRELEDKLNQKYEFIKSHLRTDPRYADLSPFISMITVEHTLIEIPLIIGTKIEKLNSQAVYWILFLAAATSSSLNDSGGISNITKFLDKIPKRRYLELIGTTDILKDVLKHNSAEMDLEGPTAAKAYTKLRSEADSDLRKAASKFSRITNDITTYEDEIGISTSFSAKNQLQYSQIIQNTNNSEFKTKVESLLSQLLYNTAFRVIQTYNNIVVDPNTEVDISPKYSALHGDILSISERGSEGVVNLITSKLTKTESASDMLKQFNNVCSSINNLQPSREIAQLSQFILTYSDIRDEIARGGNTSFSNINEEFLRIAEQLRNKSMQITKFIHNFTTGGDGNTANFESISNSARERILDALSAYYHGNGNGGPIIPQDNNGSIISDIFRMAYDYGNAVLNRETFKSFISNFIHGMADVIHFMYLFTTISYVCDMMKVVDNKIKVEESSAISFPNYTFVIPIEYLRTLYFAFAARGISAAANDQPTKDFDKFNIGESEIFRILTAVTERLNIPNLVVIDEKSKTVYYKWVFSKRLLKVNLSTIEGYIRSHRDILRV